MKMFCRKCGKEIPGDSDFCPNCGAKASWTGSTESISPEEAAKKAAERRKKKTITAAVISVGAVIVIAVVIIGVILATAKPTINLNNYITVSFEGEDGDGWCSVTLDTKKLEADYGDKVKISERDELWYGSFSEALYEKYIDWDIETTGSKLHLKNGDTVTITWNCKDKAAEEEYGVKLKHKDLKIKVSGLAGSKIENPDTEPGQTGLEADTTTGYTVVDLFDGVTVKFSELNGYGEAEIVDNRPEELKKLFWHHLEFSGNSTNLKNGDTVTVKIDTQYALVELGTGAISTNDIYQILAAKQKYPKATEKTYTVEGLKTFPDKSDISGDLLAQMKVKATELFNESIKNWDTSNRLLGTEYVGMFVLAQKAGTISRVVLAYKVQARIGATPQNGERDIEYYETVTFPGVYKKSDGQIEVDRDNACADTESSFTIDNYWRFNGYQDIEWLKAHIASKSNTFNIQTDIPWTYSIPDISEITGDILTQLQEKGTQTFYEAAKKWAYGSSILGVEYCGMYVYTLPQEQDYGYICADVVFKVKAKISDGFNMNHKEIEYYQYVSFENIYKKAGEKVVHLFSSAYPQTVRSFSVNWSSTVYGFKTLEELKSHEESFSDTYTIKTNIS